MNALTLEACAGTPATPPANPHSARTEDNSNPEADHVHGLSGLDWPNVMAELESQADTAAQPVIHPAPVVNRECPASPGQQREAAVHERTEFAFRIPGDEVKCRRGLMSQCGI
jgi:hypothetical protein